jgi:hypothetical protein
MKYKDDREGSRWTLSLGLTPGYIANKDHLVTSAWRLETKLTMSRVFSEIEFLDYTNRIRTITDLCVLGHPSHAHTEGRRFGHTKHFAIYEQYRVKADYD